MRRTATLAVAVGALLALFAGTALAVALDGTKRADRLVGTERADTIRGFGGNDTVFGRGGSDDLSGNSGNDTVRGGDGNDTVYDGPGRDTVYGGPGRDTVYGGEGDDTFKMRDGVAGNDTVRCGPGVRDVARVDSRDEAFNENSYCYAIVFEGEATGVVEGSGLCVPENCDGPSYFIQDEADGGFYNLSSETVDLSAYVGKRVTALGEIWARGARGGSMDVERVEEQ